MNDETTKSDRPLKPTEASELSEDALEQVAGGAISPGPGCVLRPPPPVKDLGR